MSIRIIRTGEDPVLRQIAKPVPEVTPAILKLLDDMAETMYHAEGIGLAANQIGIAKRLVVVDVGDDNGRLDLINPEILSSSGSQTDYEGCLSLPGIRGPVTRASHIRVKFTQRSGETVEMDAEGLLARCIQHEVDHLNGILFTDYVKAEDIVYEKESRR
ncbi:peptide deformylase [Alicyclobacillus contaminans]|uniref:peptide deformylase n=1 Tax=Alicyclobacillus contaminans TaxID=392016 RepID=UPI000409B150|nr:peptide deformylase [Alicyclobacillus contaminans]GMA49115.1 peptide deformylase [Alicyclobacillus contaminans]